MPLHVCFQLDLIGALLLSLSPFADYYILLKGPYIYDDLVLYCPKINFFPFRVHVNYTVFTSTIIMMLWLISVKFDSDTNERVLNANSLFSRCGAVVYFL